MGWLVDGLLFVGEGFVDQLFVWCDCGGDVWQQGVLQVVGDQYEVEVVVGQGLVFVFDVGDDDFCYCVQWDYGCFVVIYVGDFYFCCCQMVQMVI